MGARGSRRFAGHRPRNRLQILHCLDRYLAERSGDVKKLKPPLVGFRLRCGDYRLFFDLEGPDKIRVAVVRHRSQAYR